MQIESLVVRINDSLHNNESTCFPLLEIVISTMVRPLKEYEMTVLQSSQNQTKDRAIL